VALISVGEPTSTEKTWQLYATYTSDTGVLNLSVLIVVLSCILLVAIGFLFGWVLKTVCCSSAPAKGDDAALAAHDEEASAPLVIHDAPPAPRQWSKNESINQK
jgi:hypothetical protein